MDRRNLFRLTPWLGFFLLMAAWVHPVQSQDKYPVRNIEIVCPYSPGGSTDLSARIVADYVKTKWGVPANVTNKPGGNTVPACLEVYSAKPDGYTLFEDTQNSTSMLPIAVKNLPFKVMDRTFVAIWNMTPQMMFVPSNSSIRNLKDLEAEIKKSPETFTWTSLGGVGAQDYCMRQFLKAIGVDVLKTKPIICKGGAEATSLAGGGHVKLGAGTVTSTIGGLSAGVVRAIAITGEERIPEFPNIPTFGEQGYPTVTTTQWNGLSGPPKMPAHIPDIWGKLLQDMLKEPEVISKMKQFGLIPVYHNSSSMRELVMKQNEEVKLLWGLK
jgi:tripartite-type tricarboxylate transporter receptor subunit TctC